MTARSVPVSHPPLFADDPIMSGPSSSALPLRSAQIGGYLRGRAKTQVALRDVSPVSLRPRLAEFTAAY